MALNQKTYILAYRYLQNTRFTGHCDELNSDHTPIRLNVATSPCHISTQSAYFPRKTNVHFYQNFIDSLLNLIISLKTADEIDDAVQHFTKVIHEADSLAGI